PDRLDEGSTECGATADVLTAYRVINEAGGIVIAAHANSSHGVAMPGFDFGGQTRIAYTQDPNLQALEVTDFSSKARRRTQVFFSGTKPEYPRRMHIVQSSDAHRLTGIPGTNQELGVGDRATDVFLDELDFESLKAVFTGNDFARTRPYVPRARQEFDPIRDAREDGETLVQAFHERLWKNKSIELAILKDFVALANTNGGTIYVGATASQRTPVAGVERPTESANQLRAEIQKRIVPPLEAQIDAQKSEGKNVLRVIVPRGSEVPYALDGSYIYIRSESETNLAVRDEVIQLVRESMTIELAGQPAEPRTAGPQIQRAESNIALPEEVISPITTVAPPRTGVEVVKSEKRKGTMYYSIRDLRNNHIVHNITRSSARKLWQYAITEFQDHPVDPSKVKWIDSVGLWGAHKRAGKMRYDLVLRGPNSRLFVYYGVTEDGIHDTWRSLIESEPNLEAAAEEEISARGVDVAEPSGMHMSEPEAPLEMAHETALESDSIGLLEPLPLEEVALLSDEGSEPSEQDVEPMDWEGRIDPLPFFEETVLDGSPFPDSSETSEGMRDSSQTDKGPIARDESDVRGTSDDSTPPRGLR
ncbi:MAG TPA: ATP-binding protein, partial [Anaerolineae bacterium]